MILQPLLHPQAALSLKKHDASSSHSSIEQSAGQSKTTPNSVKVLSRFFEVGRLFTGTGEGALPEASRFIVVQATGPSHCTGLWILALPPCPWADWDENYDPPTTPLDDRLDKSMSDEELARMRSDRTTVLNGFQEPLSYARIKQDGERKEFDLVDPVASSFAISNMIWRVD